MLSLEAEYTLSFSWLYFIPETFHLPMLVVPIKILAFRWCTLFEARFTSVWNLKTIPSSGLPLSIKSYPAKTYFNILTYMYT